MGEDEAAKLRGHAGHHVASSTTGTRRMVAYKDGAAVKLVSRQGRDHTSRFPGIVAAIRPRSAPTLVLDGEVAVFDRALISRVEWLRHTAPPEPVSSRFRRIS